MIAGHNLDVKKAQLLIVDVQEKLFPLVEHPCEMLDKILKLMKGCKILQLPIWVSAQYPKGLGNTIDAIKEAAGADAHFFEKTAFSCGNDPDMLKAIEKSDRNQWIIAGIEAHVCILQTARSLLHLGKEVIVVNDAISSRSIYDFSTAIAELRDLGARITSCETVLFDLVKDSKKSEFKQIIELVK